MKGATGWALLVVLALSLSVVQGSARSVSPPAKPVRFSVVYADGNGTRLDTFKRRYTKDMIGGPDTTITLVLTRREMNRIRAKMIAIGFFDMPEPHPPYPRTGMGSMDPNTTIVIEAVDGSRSRRLSWSTERTMSVPTPAWQGLHELTRLIREVVEVHPSVRALPAVRGGYL